VHWTVAPTPSAFPAQLSAHVDLALTTMEFKHQLLECARCRLANSIELYEHFHLSGRLLLAVKSTTAMHTLQIRRGRVRLVILMKGVATVDPRSSLKGASFSLHGRSGRRSFAKIYPPSTVTEDPATQISNMPCMCDAHEYKIRGRRGKHDVALQLGKCRWKSSTRYGAPKTYWRR
jgi:hypothetical protein